jgi:hypothetical protein
MEKEIMEKEIRKQLWIINNFISFRKRKQYKFLNKHQFKQSSNEQKAINSILTTTTTTTKRSKIQNTNMGKQKKKRPNLGNQ